MSSYNELTNTLFSRKGDRLELNMETAGRRLRGGNTTMKAVLDLASRGNRINARQRKGAEHVFSRTISGRSANGWAISAAIALESHTSNSIKPIVAELRPQGSGQRRRMVVGGRIYYDINSDTEVEYLAKAVFEATDIFSGSRLTWEQDSRIISALVYGLFTRPRMADWVAVDITEGSSVEASPRCISTEVLAGIRRREAAKERQDAEEAAKAQKIRARQEKFLAWTRTFIPIAQAEAKREAGWAALLEAEVPDNWDD